MQNTEHMIEHKEGGSKIESIWTASSERLAQKRPGHSRPYSADATDEIYNSAESICTKEDAEEEGGMGAVQGNWNYVHRYVLQIKSRRNINRRRLGPIAVEC